MLSGQEYAADGGFSIIQFLCMMAMKRISAGSGIYFAVVRVKSERNGDKGQPFTQVRNIDRVRVVVG